MLALPVSERGQILSMLSCVSGLMTPHQVSMVVEEAVTAVRWVCSKPGCTRLQLVYTLPHTGLIVKKCERCGSINVLHNGKPVLLAY